MEGEKSSGVEVGPPISIVRLVLMLTTVGQQYLFLQQHDIIPSTGVCHKCHQVILGSPIVKGNERFWNCKKCKAVTTTRFGTVLYKSKMKLKNWILLAFCFTERNKSYAQTSNEASLPQEGYEDRTLSGTTMNRWYRFFRKLCRNDFQRQGGRICVTAQRALSEKFRLGQKF